MEIGMMPLGVMGTNCYLVFDDQKQGVLIDPGANATFILNAIQEQGVTLHYILLTHGHFDHVGALEEVRRATGAPVAIHQDDAYRLPQVDKEGARFGVYTAPQQPADLLLKDEQTLEAGDLQLRILHTPGHTEGGITILCGQAMFTGDTLFCDGVGRTDLPGGDELELHNSLVRIASFCDNYAVYPGHGDVTNLDREKEANPYLGGAL
ncbi:MBL fold metallo-hydrolase [Neobittarella massiliensis]|uniref:MBL fold metallo-hydrolase n=2 Tax=Oscillospiraceae TaxID=216572 RepID=A0A8J6LYA5_9FIRM|nr:MBL fold metallo-hydrolase [Neobittarella massiliensis]MBC3515117.1 MBL fold metallo-hydrolase [Neobittarella massiliensis]